LAWRLDMAHVDPLSQLTFVSGGDARFPVGTPVFLRAVSGHRDTGFTTCPGAVLYSMFGTLARRVAATGLPKLYAPSVQGQLGGLIRFQGRLTAAATVTATLRDAGGHDVATLFTQQHQPGKQSFKFTATSAPEGHFQLVLTAANSKTSVSASVPVVIDRTVTRFVVTPAVTNGAVTFSFDLARVADVKLDIRRASKSVAPVYAATLPPGTQSVGWNGAGTKDGTYAGALTTSGEAGTATRT